MTKSKALLLIVIGILSLTIVGGLVLALVDADGTAYALLMGLVLSAGGFANYLATLRYGSRAQRR